MTAEFTASNDSDISQELFEKFLSVIMANSYKKESVRTDSEKNTVNNLLGQNYQFIECKIKLLELFPHFPSNFQARCSILL